MLVLSFQNASDHLDEKHYVIQTRCHYLLQSGLLPHSWQTLAVLCPKNPRHWFLMEWLVSTALCFLNIVSVK